MLELAREGDWAAVNRLSVQVHDLHARMCPQLYFHCDEPLAKGDFLQAVRDRLLYVARLNDTVVGYVLLSFIRRAGNGVVPHKELRLEHICVDEDFRRQGIGRAMICDVRALAKAFGCREIVLGVHPQNDDAVVFYQKCGFTIRTVNLELK